MKICKKCKQEECFEMFNKHKNTTDGLQPWCKNCTREYLNEYTKDNKQVLSAEAKLKKQEYNKSWRKANKDKKYLYDKEYLINWRSDNPEKSAIHSSKRRAAKLNATPQWLTEQELSEIDRFYVLRKILEEQLGIAHHVDHIVPLQGENVCGLHVPWNLQVIPASENISKSNKLLDDLLEI